MSDSLFKSLMKSKTSLATLKPGPSTSVEIYCVCAKHLAPFLMKYERRGSGFIFTNVVKIDGGVGGGRKASSITMELEKLFGDEGCRCPYCGVGGLVFCEGCRRTFCQGNVDPKGWSSCVDGCTARGFVGTLDALEVQTSAPRFGRVESSKFVKVQSSPNPNQLRLGSGKR